MSTQGEQHPGETCAAEGCDRSHLEGSVFCTKHDLMAGTPGRKVQLKQWFVPKAIKNLARQCAAAACSQRAEFYVEMPTGPQWGQLSGQTVQLCELHAGDAARTPGVGDIRPMSGTLDEALLEMERQNMERQDITVTVPEPIQLGLPGPSDDVSREEALTIQKSFERFHEHHPEVYDNLVHLARQLRERGVERYGIGSLYEVLRWQYAVGNLTAPDDFKLNNNYRSRYARLIMLQEPDLAGFFETRELKAE